MASEMVCSHQPTMYNAQTGTYTTGKQRDKGGFKSLFASAELHREYKRLLTFLLWPPTAQAKPDQLAASGFYFTGSEDTCQCYFCGVRLRNWSVNNLPRDVHEKHSPRCRFLQGRSNDIPLEEDDEAPEEKRSVAAKAKAAKIATDSAEPSSGRRRNRNGRKNHERGNDAMKSRKARFDSFKGKWRKSEIVTVEDLVDAGFYYGKDKDRAVCAYCGIKLVGWQMGDTAYGEHFKHSPACPFITNQVTEEPEEPTSSDLYLSVDEREFMSNEDAITMARQFGHSEKVIESAVEKLEKSGTLEFNATSLLDAIYKIQDDISLHNGIPEPGDLVEEEEDDKVELDPEMLKLKEENTRLKMKCLACGENKAEVLLLPCREIVSCNSCSSKLKKCPKCKAVIKGVVKTYFA